MLTRRASAALLLVLAVAGAALAVGGCAAPDQAGAPAPATSDVIDLPLPSVEPSAGKPAAGGAQTISGTVSAGVEPNCLLLTSDGTSHLLVFDDPALRADAAVGKSVTLVGRAEPSLMSTCQQGVPFIVTSVSSS